MTMLPISFCLGSKIGTAFYFVFACNIIVHAFVDNMKANKFKINLIQDQIIHIIQILITFFILY